MNSLLQMLVYFWLDGVRGRGGKPPRDERFLIICFQLWTSQFHLQLNLVSFRIGFFFFSPRKQIK